MQAPVDEAVLSMCVAGMVQQLSKFSCFSSLEELIGKHKEVTNLLCCSEIGSFLLVPVLTGFDVAVCVGHPGDVHESVKFTHIRIDAVLMFGLDKVLQVCPLVNCILSMYQWGAP